MDRIISLLIYIIVMYGTFLGVKKTENEKSYIKKIVIWIPLILLFTFRIGVGTDYYNYYGIVGRTPNVDLFTLILNKQTIEIGQATFAWVSKFFNSFNIFLFLNLIFMIFPFQEGIKKLQKKPVYPLSIFMFLTMFFLMGLNIGYQFIAAGFVLLSYRYILDRNFKMFLCYILIATLFHNTALLIIPIYFIWTKKQDTFYYIYLLIFIAIFTVLVLNFDVILSSGIMEGYEIYAESTVVGKNRDILIKGLILVVGLVFSKHLIALDKNNKFYLILLVLGFIIGLTGFNSAFVKRIGLYFDISQILILPQICLIFFGEQKKMIYLILIFSSVTYLVLVYYILGSADVFPYQFGILGW
ncbi:MAG: EpsG family protein [Culicoidibacterales bacterium]